MRVFVTGASGFIGTYVSIALRREGHSVCCLVRSAQKGATLVQHECELVVGDLDNASTYLEVYVLPQPVVNGHL